MKSTVARAILAPAALRGFVKADVHPTTFREEPNILGFALMEVRNAMTGENPSHLDMGQRRRDK